MVREPEDDEVVIQVHSSSLNPADYKSAQGEQKMLLTFDWPRVIGFDFAGTVHQRGSGATKYEIGDPVFGMIQGLGQRDRGTLQEYVVVKEKVIALKPSNITMAEAAAIPLVSITAVMMCESAGLTQSAVQPSTADAEAVPRIRVLILGGAGGVGVHAIQIAKQLFGATFVATTASLGEKTELCRRVGADLVIDYRNQKFEIVLANELPFDAVLDCTGEADKCIGLLKKGGGMTSILAGPTSTAIKDWLAMSEWPKNKITTGVLPFLNSGCGGHLFGFFAGGHSLTKKCSKRNSTFAHIIATGNGENMSTIASLMKHEKLKAIIDKEFPLVDAVDALMYLKAGHCAGKVVVNIVPCE
jgi:NADPH:quinone reductase-like Zn-dependent oxidoreductase